ncbi:MAG: hypothetical protein HY982_02655 [Candidatus Magasanikbacteria bacterium]|nr:hypothetical protein [Candidatus Magasanikbacteria bacterium]
MNLILMSRIILREEAVALRKKGMSYSQIKSELKIPKSTLACWLQGMPLSEERINELRGRSVVRIEKFRNTMLKKREKRLMEIYKLEKEKFPSLSKREQMIAGLALYWGEGSKSDWSKIALANTDPGILKFFAHWLVDLYDVERKNFRVSLQLYKNMDMQKKLNYWSKELGINRKQFTKPYIKCSSSNRINHRGSFGHGTCTIAVYSVLLKEKIMTQLKILAESYK